MFDINKNYIDYIRKCFCLWECRHLTAANWWNTRIFTVDVAEYTGKVAHIEKSELDKIFVRAHEYNRERAQIGHIFYPLTDKEREYYNSQLNIDGTELSMMGYISISKLDVKLPIYHSASNATLKKAAY